MFSSSDKTGHKRGVATLFSNTINYKHISEIMEDEGRFVRITERIDEIILTVLNVYIAPGSDWVLYRHIFDLMVNSQGVVLCGGDFNIKLQSKLHSSGPANQNNPLNRKVKSFMEDMGIIDVWRELHPNS